MQDHRSTVVSKSLISTYVQKGPKIFIIKENNVTNKHYIYVGAISVWNQNRFLFKKRLDGTFSPASAPPLRTYDATPGTHLIGCSPVVVRGNPLMTADPTCCQSPCTFLPAYIIIYMLIWSDVVINSIF